MSEDFTWAKILSAKNEIPEWKSGFKATVIKIL